MQIIHNGHTIEVHTGKERPFARNVSTGDTYVRLNRRIWRNTDDLITDQTLIDKLEAAVTEASRNGQPHKPPRVTFRAGIRPFYAPKKERAAYRRPRREGNRYS